MFRYLGVKWCVTCHSRRSTNPKLRVYHSWEDSAHARAWDDLPDGGQGQPPVPALPHHGLRHAAAPGRSRRGPARACSARRATGPAATTSPGGIMKDPEQGEHQRACGCPPGRCACDVIADRPERRPTRAVRLGRCGRGRGRARGGAVHVQHRHPRRGRHPGRRSGPWQRPAARSCGVAVPDREAAAALGGIVKGSPLPVIADIHFDHRLALAALEAGVHGLRLNPGNIGARWKVEEVVGRGAGARGADPHRGQRRQPGTRPAGAPRRPHPGGPGGERPGAHPHPGGARTTGRSRSASRAPTCPRPWRPTACSPSSATTPCTWASPRRARCSGAR